MGLFRIYPLGSPLCSKSSSSGHHFTPQVSFSSIDERCGVPGCPLDFFVKCSSKMFGEGVKESILDLFFHVVFKTCLFCVLPRLMSFFLVANQVENDMKLLMELANQQEGTGLGHHNLHSAWGNNYIVTSGQVPFDHSIKRLLLTAPKRSVLLLQVYFSSFATSTLDHVAWSCQHDGDGKLQLTNRTLVTMRDPYQNKCEKEVRAKS